MKKLLELIRKVQKDKFWGELKITIKDGEVKLVEIRETVQLR